MADVHACIDPPSEKELQMMRERMSAYIFPNEVRSEDERTAFEKAVAYQIAHEKSLDAKMGQLDTLQVLPDGVTSFSIGTFAMSFGDGYRKSVTLDHNTICPYAYGVLLRAGLLYKGVPGE